MYVSEITYGNWITHGSQVEQEAAIKCVRAALDNGITTFDTADVYAGTRAETVLGKALKGVRRESYELLTKVYWPTGPGKNDRGLSRKHIMESVHASLTRLKTDHIDLYQKRLGIPRAESRNQSDAFDRDRCGQSSIEPVRR